MEATVYCRLDPFRLTRPNLLWAATHGQPDRGAGPGLTRRLGG
jgi:hypothetical protein